MFGVSAEEGESAYRQWFLQASLCLSQGDICQKWKKKKKDLMISFNCQLTQSRIIWDDSCLGEVGLWVCMWSLYFD